MRLAVSLIRTRLKDEYGKATNYEVVGEPVALGLGGGGEPWEVVQVMQALRSIDPDRIQPVGFHNPPAPPHTAAFRGAPIRSTGSPLISAVDFWRG